MPELRSVFSELLKGKSLTRALSNVNYKNVSIGGKVLDVGAKSGSASLYRYIKIQDKTEFKYVDLESSSDDIIKADIEKHIPIEDDSFDTIILNFVLEHIYATDKCLSECSRVLRPGGKLVGCVPFICRYHADPNDFWRFTPDTLKKVFSENGFSKVEVVPLGIGPFTTSCEILRSVFPRKILYIPLFAAGIVCDTLYKLAYRIIRRKSPVNHSFLACYFCATL